MAQDSSERRRTKRIEPAVQRRFDCEPGGESIRLQFGREFTRERAIAGGVDGERQAGAVRSKMFGSS